MHEVVIGLAIVAIILAVYWRDIRRYVRGYKEANIINNDEAMNHEYDQTDGLPEDIRKLKTYNGNLYDVETGVNYTYNLTPKLETMEKNKIAKELFDSDKLDGQMATDDMYLYPSMERLVFRENDPSNINDGTDYYLRHLGYNDPRL